MRQNNKMRRINKKGQMKIQQMVFMLMAVTLLFVLVGVFFLSIRLSNLKKTASSLEEKNSMLLVSKLANSPEFSCGEAFGTSRTNCIDFDKLMALKARASDYSNFWGVAEIEIMIIYPNNGETPCEQNNYPDCGVIEVLNKNVNSQAASSNFVSLCRKEVTETKIYDKCELALLMVYAEDKS